MNLIKLLSSASPSKKYYVELLKQKLAEVRIVEKWGQIGIQFNLAQWVSDTEIQKKILCQSNISLFLHLKNFYIGVKNLFLIFIFFVKVALSKIKNKIKNLERFSEIVISYSVHGLNHRVVKPVSNNHSQKCLEIVFNENGNLNWKNLYLFKISDLFRALKVLTKSLKYFKSLSSKEISYFIKEIYDFHCFQHCIIAFMAKRNAVKRIFVVGEGFPREICLDITKSFELVRVNVSPTINLNRLNTFYWKGDFIKMDKYKFNEKSRFLSKLPTYKKKYLPLSQFIKKAKYFNKKLVLVPGFSKFSINVCEKLKIYLLNYLSIDIIIKYHPRLTVKNVTVDDNDIVIAENSTQFGLLRHLNNPNSKTFYFSEGTGAIFDPAPYTNIPLIIGELNL